MYPEDLPALGVGIMLGVGISYLYYQHPQQTRQLFDAMNIEIERRKRVEENKSWYQRLLGG